MCLTVDLISSTFVFSEKKAFYFFCVTRGLMCISEQKEPRVLMFFLVASRCQITLKAKTHLEVSDDK